VPLTVELTDAQRVLEALPECVFDTVAERDSEGLAEGDRVVDTLVVAVAHAEADAVAQPLLLRDADIELVSDSVAEVERVRVSVTVAEPLREPLGEPLAVLHAERLRDGDGVLVPLTEGDRETIAETELELDTETLGDDVMVGVEHADTEGEPEKDAVTQLVLDAQCVAVSEGESVDEVLGEPLGVPLCDVQVVADVVPLGEPLWDLQADAE